jgi:hypothetical protein
VNLRGTWCTVLVLALSGCLDTEGRYQDFLDRTEAQRASEDSGVASSERVDFSGDYLLALSTVVAPDAPILFATRVQVAEDLTQIDLELQPLTTDDAAPAREPVGASIVANGVPYAEDGTFEADLGTVQVAGAANPITGSDITANVRIVGVAQPTDGGGVYFFCGDAFGMVTVPLSLDLAGSSFGAVATTDPANAEPLLSCPAAQGDAGSR